MLTASRMRVLAVAFAGAVGFVLAMSPMSPAGAGGGSGGVSCPADGSGPPACSVDAGHEGDKDSKTGGGSAGGQPAGDGRCRNPQGAEIPCQRDGGWAGGDGCYYKPADVPPDTAAGMGGQPVGEGGWYEKTCYLDPLNGAGMATSLVWVPGAPPVVSPEVLARQARSRLTLPAVAIRINPSGDQLVGLPTWLALDPSSWSLRSATASVPGVSVTATARPVSASWQMGDGSTVVCAGPGTPWRPETDPAASSPDCGHRHLRSSAGAPGAAFAVRVTITWTVAWAGAGTGGTIPGLTTTGAAAVRVAESQAVNR
jgi:hypothetical protein